MQQLPLPVRLRASSIFSSYFAGPNAEVVQRLQFRQLGSSPLVFLYGAHAAGKTHLLQAMCAQGDAQPVSYMTGRDLLMYGPELLLGFAPHSVLCIDDVDAALGDIQWNRSLFALYQEMEEAQGKLIMSALQPPAAYAFPLADLASRVMASMVLRLQPLNDDEQLSALQLHASQRGLELSLETAQYLLRRLPRDMNTLCDFLDELDIASLAEQRRLTVPFVKQVLDQVLSRRI